MTALDFITASLKILGVLADNEAPSSEEAKDGLQSLNDMLESWKVESRLATSLASFTSYSLNDTISLGDGWNRAIKYNLAIEMAPEYGVTISREVFDTAKKAITIIKRKNYVKVPVAVDAALLPVTKWDINA